MDKYFPKIPNTNTASTPTTSDIPNTSATTTRTTTKTTATTKSNKRLSSSLLTNDRPTKIAAAFEKTYLSTRVVGEVVEVLDEESFIYFNATITNKNKDG
jgi:hypothetical protein